VADVATRAQRPAQTAVYLESGSKRVFAGALDWPGWLRSGKDEALALEALAAAAPRYAAVAAEAGIPFPKSAAGAFEVAERVAGSATTDFGAPGAVPAHDTEPLTQKEAHRLAALMAASWTIFDRVVAGAPAELRKGPRGGGRDRDAMVDHVLAAEAAYAGKLGIRFRQPARGDATAVSALRKAILEALTASRTRENGWPPRYAARRIAWHVLDHAWEIENRSPGSDSGDHEEAAKGKVRPPVGSHRVGRS
jgi:hypothetical protein